MRPASIPIRVIEPTRSSLMAARSTGATIPSTKAISLGEGYEIGDEVKKERLAGGWRRVGWKLDFTNMGLVAGARRRRKATTALDGPVPALVWLSRLLPDGLRAGDIVTTGSIVAATPVIAGERWTNRLSGPLSSSVEFIPRQFRIPMWREQNLHHSGLQSRSAKLSSRVFLFVRLVSVPNPELLTASRDPIPVCPPRYGRRT